VAETPERPRRGRPASLREKLKRTDATASAGDTTNPTTTTTTKQQKTKMTTNPVTTTLSTPRVLTPGARRLLRACGYDDAHVARLAPADARFFVVASVLVVVAAVTAGGSMAYGAALTVGNAAAPFLAIVVGLFVMNLLRLHHAGSGYPLHHPIAGIDRRRPAGAAVVVLFTLGAFLTQPLVLLVLRPWIDADLAARTATTQALQQQLGIEGSEPVHGLIARTHAAWDGHADAFVALSLAFSLLVAAPVLLRRTGARAVRLYESERWVAERMFVDDAWAENLHAVTSILRRTAPGFTGRLQVHSADPPYNTRPLVFGLDPALFVPGRLRFVRPAGPIEPAPAIALPGASLPPEDAAAAFEERPANTVAPSTLPGATPPLPAAAPPPPPASSSSLAVASSESSEAESSEAESSSSESSSSSTAAPAPSPRPVWAGRSAVDVGRLTTGEVRADIRAHIDFLTAYLELPRDDVLRALVATPPKTPLYAAFPQWSNAAKILLRPAAFALDAGLAPLIAVAVDKSPEQVERRLQAAPPDARVSAVFAPELARRLLRGRPP
jgi:hypothetical protein